LRPSLLVLCVAIALGGQPLMRASAEAGSYDVFTCSQPNGSAAPADGWSSFSNNAYMVVEDKCATGNYLLTGMFGWVPVPVGAESGWTFLPPAGTFITQAT